MLDFHIIKDFHSKLKEGLYNNEYIGGISFDDFNYLKHIHIIEPELDYFKDFEWNDAQVQSKYESLEALMNQSQIGSSEAISTMFN
ncbi:MAG TPA: hypothetical protein VM010_03040, partial [Chitinophagaceae bacterium]|nr:hypothetical protein [Chitinophagaceae bacterium]